MLVAASSVVLEPRPARALEPPCPPRSRPSPTSEPDRPVEPRPAILLVSALHGEVLTRQFRRYAHEYDVRAMDSQPALSADLVELEAQGSPVALLVLDTSPRPRTRTDRRPSRR